MIPSISPRTIALAVAGVALVAFLAWIIRIDTLRARHLKDLQQLEQRYTAAQNEAATRARAEIQRHEQESKDRANEADQNELRARVDDRAAVDRYIATHRVRTCPAASAASGPVTAAESDGAQSDHGSGSDAVVATEDDLRICTVNSRRLSEAHDWGVKLEASQPGPAHP